MKTQNIRILIKKTFKIGLLLFCLPINIAQGATGVVSKEPVLNPVATAAQSSKTTRPTNNAMPEQWYDLMQSLDNSRTDETNTNAYQLNGLFTLDYHYKTHPQFTPHHKHDFSLSTTKFNFTKRFNNTAFAHFGLFYADDAKRYYPNASTHHSIDVEEGYLSLSHFQNTPFYINVGRSYLPFGHYRRYALLPSLPQQLSETRATALHVGLINKTGPYGSIYTFHGLEDLKKHNVSAINDWGTTIGYKKTGQILSLNLRMSYLNNMADVGSIARELHHYFTKTCGTSIDLDLSSGPFDGHLGYVIVLDHFDPQEFSFQKEVGRVRGAHPQAGRIKTGYTFHYLDHKNKITLGYEWSREAHQVASGFKDPLQLPFYRMTVSFGSHILKKTFTEIEIAHERDYPLKNGGTHRFNMIGVWRLTWLLT